MNEVFRKLQYKDEESIYVLGSPPEFETALDEMREMTVVSTRLADRKRHGFALFFVRSQAEIVRLARRVDKLGDDATLWFAYPKKSSRRYTADIDRGSGWQPLGDLGFEGVRQVAIDADWSALRFRKADRIKTLTRSRRGAISAEGKRRARL